MHIQGLWYYAPYIVWRDRQQRGKHIYKIKLVSDDKYIKNKMGQMTPEWLCDRGENKWFYNVGVMWNAFPSSFFFFVVVIVFKISTFVLGWSSLCLGYYFLCLMSRKELLQNICNQLTKCIFSCFPYLIFVCFLSNPGIQRRVSFKIYIMFTG